MSRTGFTTRQVHAAGTVASANPRATPIYLTAGFSFGHYDDAAAHFGHGEGFAYTRTGNPTTATVEATIADLEGGSGALLVATGQAATSIAIMSVVSAGQHVVSSTHIYEGTRGLLLDALGRFGIDTDFVDDIADPGAWERLIRPTTRALFAETLSNGSCRVLDIAQIAEVAHRHGIPLIVDNTVATPYLLRPIEHGADIVVHSASKFFCGHGSVLGGVIVDNGRFEADAAQDRFPQFTTPVRGGGPSFAARAGGDARLLYAREALAQRFGPTLSPLSAFLIGQGMETMSLRVQRQCVNAVAVAGALAQHPHVRAVDHPSVAGHPDAARVDRYLPDGQGSVFTFHLRGGEASARRFVEALELVTHMTHIGDVRTLVLNPGATSHVALTPEQQAAVGVFPGTLRLSIGIEDADDLIADLTQALDILEA